MFYRLSVWLPLVVPAVVIVVVNLTRWRPVGTLGVILQLIAYSGIVGGIPYLALAIWAMFWIGRRSEREIRRRAILAPLLMILTFTAWPALLALHAEPMSAFGVFTLGAAVILALGYAYVLIVFMLRALLFGRMGRQAASA
jgi:hypothetical protein